VTFSENTFECASQSGTPASLAQGTPAIGWVERILPAITQRRVSVLLQATIATLGLRTQAQVAEGLKLFRRQYTAYTKLRHRLKPHLRGLSFGQLARSTLYNSIVCILHVDGSIQRDSSRAYSYPYLATYLPVPLAYGFYLLNLIGRQIQLPHKVAVRVRRTGISLTRRRALLVLRENVRRGKDQ
jgi:hypothetical protein